MAQKKGGLSTAMIVIAAVLGLCVVSGVALAIVGYSSFQSFVVRSKTSEATSQLATLFQASAGYYANEQWGSGGAAAVTACTVGPATTSNTPGPNKAMLDPMTLPESFTAIGWTPADPLYYRYAIAGGPGGCGHGAGEALYTFSAHGDLDGDTAESRYWVGVRSNVNNELERDPAIASENELE